MSDYIKRGEAFYAVSEEAGMLKKVVFDRIIKRLESIPSADVEPVRPHGKWKYNTFCSECDKDFSEYFYYTEDGGVCELPKFCPNCGARMDGEEE